MDGAGQAEQGGGGGRCHQAGVLCGDPNALQIAHCTVQINTATVQGAVCAAAHTVLHNIILPGHGVASIGQTMGSHTVGYGNHRFRAFHMVDKLQSGGVQVNQIADALGGHVRIQQSGGHHTGVAVAQGAAGVEGMAQTCKSSRKSTLGGLVISISVPGLHPDTSRRQNCAKFQRTGKLRGKGHLPDDGFIPLYQRLVRGEGWRQQRGGWHGTGTFGTQKGSFQMNTQNMRAGQFACGLLLHGGLYHRQRPAHGGQRLRPKGEQHIRYAVAQQDGQELGQGAFIQLRVKALAAVAVQVNQSGC